jgi:hypothetical protein
MMDLFNPRIWLAFLLAVIVSLGTGAYAGYRYEKQAQQVAVAKIEVSDSDVARNKEQAADVTMATIGAALTNQQIAEKAKADNEIAMLKAKLAKTPTCTVSGSVVGMLYPGTSANVPATTATGFGAGGTTAYADSSCGAQLELAARNYREVCEPNAEQLKALQDVYNDLREQFNTKPEK